MLTALAVVLKAALAGITGAILRWWAAYRQGIKAQQVEDQAATIKKEHEVTDAVDSIKNEPARDFFIGPDGRVYRVRGQRQTPDLHSGTQSDLKPPS